jgi:beta-lactamase class A
MDGLGPASTSATSSPAWPTDDTSGSRRRDGNSTVHGYVGRTMRVEDLARHMITTSSNLATNVLVELLGTDAIPAYPGRRWG